MWANGDFSCQEFFDASDDFCWRRWLLNNGSRRAFVIDFSVPCVQDERDASRLKLQAKVTAVTAKDRGCKIWNIAQVGIGVLDQHSLRPLCLKRSGQRRGDRPDPLNDQDDATTKAIIFGHLQMPLATN